MSPENNTPNTPATWIAAPLFDGQSGYVEIPSHADYAMQQGGGITIEAWIRPASLAMPKQEGSGYVYWLSKGDEGKHEWAFRMYQLHNTEGRDNRISFYCFNPGGGEGVGSYFQDELKEGVWLHVVGQFNRLNTSIFCNGAWRKSDLLRSLDIVPQHNDAPVRIGALSNDSYFQGAIARVAIYGVELDFDAITRHYRAGTQNPELYDDVICNTPGVISYWKLNETEGTVAHDLVGHNDGTYYGGIQLTQSTQRPF